MSTFTLTPSSRRRWLGQAGAATAWLASPALWAARPTAAAKVEVWKDPSCGCCQDWIVHMQQNGFTLTVHESGNAAIRTQLGLPAQLGSCHTALVDGYLLEGHVPASDVRKLLQRQPKALGLAVPGMPVGSPGMDGAVYNGRRDPYDVLLVRKDGANKVRTEVFTSYR